MNTLTTVLAILVALEHLYIMFLENHCDEFRKHIKSV